MKNLKGTWLMIKTGDDYSQPEFIEFENDEILHFELEKTNGIELSKKVTNWTEKISESKYEFINANRIRIFRMGKTYTVISETESKTDNKEFSTDYEKISPTKTELKAEEIEKLEFKAQWNDEKIRLVFNKILDSPTIQEINQRRHKNGQKLALENLQGTYFVSIYNNDERETLIGIKEINEKKAILFGFPERPYEILAE
ncbi:hypothetical protein QVZ41_14125 [Wenyingzhuangia sp. chi5]|uniref:Lipocalin-like protein n=1 Tax=Wenyingzhuangia gilva TaxID=3057677 RepID=A0ABT8VVJ4_9FLAO|nr:hypothetical protein [Wenyingzhuangia sp. chi5]MDO3695985.1 hypothetical protein [Wenyingzhuangia sp. chi5]